MITSDLRETLREFLAFRHLFRGASIAMMQWDKLAPLPLKLDETHTRTKLEIEAFTAFLPTG